MSLTPRRAEILAYLRQAAQQGLAPSLAEIAERFGFASRNAARKHVQALAEAGLVEHQAGRMRGIRVPGAPARDQLLALPVLGRVAAGLPIGADAPVAAEPGLERELWLDRGLFSLRPDYLLVVQGDSMIDDGILDGDLVGVHRCNEARDGQTVVARIDGEITIKRLQRGQDRVRLLPRNRAHAPIDIEAGSDFAVEGLFCGLVRRG